MEGYNFDALVLIPILTLYSLIFICSNLWVSAGHSVPKRKVVLYAFFIGMFLTLFSPLYLFFRLYKYRFKHT